MVQCEALYVQQSRTATGALLQCNPLGLPRKPHLQRTRGRGAWGGSWGELRQLVVLEALFCLSDPFDRGAPTH